MVFPAGPNTANFNNQAVIPNNIYGLRGVVATSVGTNGGPSAYGTYDQNGNVWEWILSIDKKNSTLIDSMIGGAFDSRSTQQNLSRRNEGGSVKLSGLLPIRRDNLGFRLAFRSGQDNRVVNTIPNLRLVGDSGNTVDDLTLVGRVDYQYYISAYTVTVCEWVDFLNAVAQINDLWKLYDSSYKTSLYIRRQEIVSSGGPSSKRYQYSVNSEIVKNMPITNVNIIQCMAYCNWLTNGKKNDPRTLYNGLYNINHSFVDLKIEKWPEGVDRDPEKNKTGYYLPSLNEWFKAAYYKGNGKNSGYWNYATQKDSNIQPISFVSKDGNGPFFSSYICPLNEPPRPTSSLVPSPTPTAAAINNTVNAFNLSSWNNTTGNFTTVGSNGKSSYYGTYDQNGNIYEYCDSPLKRTWAINAQPDSVSLCGGCSVSRDIYELRSVNTVRSVSLHSTQPVYNGFRVASKNNINNIDNFVFVPGGGFADVNGLGSVNYDYYIGKYTITNCEYAEFLNAAASDLFDITQPWRIYNIFDVRMQTSQLGGIIQVKINDNKVYYTTKPNMANKPVNFITWFMAARYCNWLHNGKPVSTIPGIIVGTETGAYELNGLYFGKFAVTKNNNAKYYLPTVDEWYKAAFHKGSGTSSFDSYWLYATQSNDSPAGIFANSVGNGPVSSSYSCSGISVTPTSTNVIPTPTPSNPQISPTPVISSPGTNTANINFGANWSNNINITTVGTNGGPSSYGTYDQTGNVWEWNDLGSVVYSNFHLKGIRGGAFSSDASGASSRIRSARAITFSSHNVGFRIASKNNSLNYNNMCFVGDVTNTQDSTFGYGFVDYSYYIGKYTITNNDYIEFLNAVAKNDILNLYNLFMSTTPNGGISVSGSPGSFTYTAKTNMGNKPVVFVTWLDAARYCNWLHWGKPSGSDFYITETGAYNLNRTNSALVSIIKNVDANYYIPTENEWYKAAYYKGSGMNSGYWLYATQSNIDPLPVRANSSGDGF